MMRQHRQNRPQRYSVNYQNRLRINLALHLSGVHVAVLTRVTRISFYLFLPSFWVRIPSFH